MMKVTNQHLRSKHENNEQKKPRPWLEKHYQEKRQRTVRLVRASVDQLVQQRQPVTIEAICRVSIEIDAERRGVKKSSILDNPEAHAYYREHSPSYQTAQRRKRQGTRSGKMTTPSVGSLRIDPDREVDRVRRRYLHMTKAELVERLLAIEQTYAESQRQLARLQFELAEQQRETEALKLGKTL